LKFEIYTDAEGKIRFRLKARNGEIIAQSEAYDSSQACKKGIAAVKRSASAKVVTVEA
jgi:hypothetical protein